MRYHLSNKVRQKSQNEHFQKMGKLGNNMYTKIQMLLTKYATIPMIFLLATVFLRHTIHKQAKKWQESDKNMLNNSIMCMSEYEEKKRKSKNFNTYITHIPYYILFLFSICWSFLVSSQFNCFGWSSMSLIFINKTMAWCCCCCSSCCILCHYHRKQGNYAVQNKYYA